MNWSIQCFIAEPSTVHTNDVFTVLAETNSKQIQSPFNLFKMPGITIYLFSSASATSKYLDADMLDEDHYKNTITASPLLRVNTRLIKGITLYNVFEWVRQHTDIMTCYSSWDYLCRTWFFYASCNLACGGDIAPNIDVVVRQITIGLVPFFLNQALERLIFIS